MPGGLIRKMEFQVIKVAFAFHFNFITLENFGHPAHFFIGYSFVNHYNSIIDVATFYQVIIQ